MATFDGPALAVLGKGFDPGATVQLTLSEAEATTTGQDLIALPTMTANTEGTFHFTMAWGDLGFVACTPELSPQIEARTGDTRVMLPLCDPAPLIIA